MDMEPVGDDTQQKKAIDREARKRSANLVIGGVLLIIAIVVPLAVFLPDISNEQDVDVGNAIMLPASTFAPTPQMERMETALQLVLPDYTLRKLKHPGSPQSFAYQWILQDPKLVEYIDTEWRVLQRFALVTFYYATGGDGWVYNDHWLSYEHDECEWYAYVAFGPPPEITGGLTGILPEFPNACELHLRGDGENGIANAS